jgi:hypothetical protein
MNFHATMGVHLSIQVKVLQCRIAAPPHRIIALLLFKRKILYPGKPKLHTKFLSNVLLIDRTQSVLLNVNFPSATDNRAQTPDRIIAVDIQK